MTQGKLLSYDDDLTEVFHIRRRVFVEELNNPEEIEFDELDNTAIHAIVYEKDTDSKDIDNNPQSNIAVATGRIIYDGEKCYISHICVLHEHRKKKYGDFAVRMLLNKGFASGVDEVSLITPNLLEVFFKKIGFKKVGETFTMNGQEYQTMIIHLNDLKTACKTNKT